MESDALADSLAGPETPGGIAEWLPRSGWRYTDHRSLQMQIAEEQEVFAPDHDVISSAAPAK